MRIADSILMELEREKETTEKYLKQVPGDKLPWKPHEKSLSLGQLARHVAVIPGDVAMIVKLDCVEVPEFKSFPEIDSSEKLIPLLHESIGRAKEILNQLDDNEILKPWKLTKNGNEIVTIPKIAVIRSIMLNHWYHHRGQLSIYLRMTGSFVPSSYGPSADENPYS